MSVDYTVSSESYAGSTYRPYDFMNFDDFPQFRENIENIRNDMIEFVVPELDVLLGNRSDFTIEPLHVVWELPNRIKMRTADWGSVSAFSVVLTMSDTVITVYLVVGGRTLIAESVDLLVVDAYGLRSGCDRGYVTFAELRCASAADARLLNDICSAVLGREVSRYSTSRRMFVPESVDYTACGSGYGYDGRSFDAIADDICSLTGAETMEIRQGVDDTLIADMGFDMDDMAFVNYKGRSFGLARVLLTFERERVRRLYLTVCLDGYGGENEFEYLPESDKWWYSSNLTGFDPKYSTGDPEFVGMLRALARIVNPDSDDFCVGGMF